MLISVNMQYCKEMPVWETYQKKLLTCESEVEEKEGKAICALIRVDAVVNSPIIALLSCVIGRALFDSNAILDFYYSVLFEGLQWIHK